MDILGYINLVWAVGEGTYGTWVQPMVYGMATGEAAKRAAKFKGINNPIIPWSASILSTSAFAYGYYDPAIVSGGMVGFMFGLGVMTPVIHTIILYTLASNKYTAGLAKTMAGKTKSQIDPDTITISEEHDDEGKTVMVVRGDTDEEDDKTIMRTVKKKILKVVKK